VKTLAVARRPTSAPDGVLVQEAAAGGGGSYGALYDRYSEQVYNYCLRLTGSPEDAADATQEAFVNVLRRLQDDDRPVLDFSSYLFAAARNESYALMRRRSRTHPTDEAPELAAAAATTVAAAAPDLETDPERSVLLQDSQVQVRQANAQLAPRHREVLALREVAGRSYEEIGQIMGISENAVAQLIWRARSKLKGALTAGAVASVVAASDDCETAQLLLNRLEDDEPITDEEQDWLDEHLEECGSCRAARGLIFEVGTSYRMWAPVGVLAALRPEVLTQAGAVVGADWSAVAGKAGVSQATVGGAATGVAVLAAAGIALSGLLQDDGEVARRAVPLPETPAAAAAAKPKPAKPPAVKTASVRASKANAATAPATHMAPAARERPPTAPPPVESRPQPGAEPAPKPAPKPELPPQQPAEPRANPEPPAAPPQVDPRSLPPPPPAAGGECTFPGKGLSGGCPPGHGGIPPGHGGIAPGQVGKR
jgi:RNA polymerase sigma factor (sigma-70 family)